MVDVGSKILVDAQIITVHKAAGAVAEIIMADLIITAIRNKDKVAADAAVEIMEADPILEAASLKRDIKQ